MFTDYSTICSAVEFKPATLASQLVVIIIINRLYPLLGIPWSYDPWFQLYSLPISLVLMFHICITTSQPPFSYRHTPTELAMRLPSSLIGCQKLKIKYGTLSNASPSRAWRVGVFFNNKALAA